jgi:hypothetical protein
MRNVKMSLRRIGMLGITQFGGSTLEHRELRIVVTIDEESGILIITAIDLAKG